MSDIHYCVFFAEQNIEMSPSKHLFFNVLLFLLGASAAMGQAVPCRPEFDAKVVQMEGERKAQIVLTARGDDTALDYEVRAFTLDNAIVERFSSSFRLNQSKIYISDLEPGTYWLKVSWQNGCYQTLGGLNGLTIESNGTKP